MKQIIATYTHEHDDGDQCWTDYCTIFSEEGKLFLEEEQGYYYDKSPSISEITVEKALQVIRNKKMEITEDGSMYNYDFKKIKDEADKNKELNKIALDYLHSVCEKSVEIIDTKVICQSTNKMTLQVCYTTIITICPSDFEPAYRTSSSAICYLHIEDGKVIDREYPFRYLERKYTEDGTVERLKKVETIESIPFVVFHHEANLIPVKDYGRYFNKIFSEEDMKKVKYSLEHQIEYSIYEIFGKAYLVHNSYRMDEEYFNKYESENGFKPIIDFSLDVIPVTNIVNDLYEETL